MTNHYKDLAIALSEAQAEELALEQKLKRRKLGKNEYPLALLDQHWCVEDVTPLRVDEV